MNKKINIKTDIKFEVGDKAYYCVQIKGENSEIQNITIKSVHISVSISLGGKSIQIRYGTAYKDQWGYPYKILLSAGKLYKNKTEIYEAERNYKKRLHKKEVAKNRTIIKTKQEEIKKLQIELDEIKKEELIETISGINTNKSKK